MNQDVMQLISRLETRSRQLILQYEKLQARLAQTEKKLEEEKEYSKALEEENHELQENYKRLKMARLIDMADSDDLKQTRKRINKMIASVDLCIAKLAPANQ